MKVSIVSTILPSGHYTEYLAGGLAKQKNVKLILYADKNPKNLTVKNCGEIKLVWSKSPLFIFQILSQILKDKPDIVHFQHEINMFGGMFTAIIFPFLVLFSRLTGAKIVTTIHATVMPSQIDDEFVTTFNQNPKIIKPILLKIFFRYLYVTICTFSDLCVVHTKTAKRVLMDYFPRGVKKMCIIPTTIPSIEKTNLIKKKYFLYFGYIARRKGLENVINGFKQYCEENQKTNFQLLLAGGVINGQEDSLVELKKSISVPNIKNKIKYLGFLEKDKQNKLYEEAYGVVIPAKLSISTSGPLYHALSHGKFVIASNIGHLKDEINSGYNGYLISNNHWYQAFTKSINNPKWVARIEKGAAETALKRNAKVTAERHVEIYNQV